MEQFYRLNPKKMTRYQPFLNEQYKRQAIGNDEQAWRNGGYVQAAIAAAFPKGRRYPTQPNLAENYTVDEDGDVHEITDADRFWAFATSMNQAREIKEIDEKIAAEKAEKKSSQSINDGDSQ